MRSDSCEFKSIFIQKMRNWVSPKFNPQKILPVNVCKSDTLSVRKLFNDFFAVPFYSSISWVLGKIKRSLEIIFLIPFYIFVTVAASCELANKNGICRFVKKLKTSSYMSSLFLFIFASKSWFSRYFAPPTSKAKKKQKENDTDLFVQKLWNQGNQIFNYSKILSEPRCLKSRWCLFLTTATRYPCSSSLSTRPLPTKPSLPSTKICGFELSTQNAKLNKMFKILAKEPTKDVVSS